MIMNIKGATDMLLNLPVEIAVLLSGNHGIGKSAIVKQAAQLLGIPCIDFRLSQCDVADLKGMPFHVKGRTIFAPPKEIPITKESADEIKTLLGLMDEISIGTYGDSGFLFLDEINRANREVQNAVFEWIYDRSLNGYKLPPGWRVVAAINGDDSIYTVNAMEPAFLSRFCLIDLQPTYEEWLSWAEGDGKIHPAVTQFIRKKADENLLDPTPEMIKEASKLGVVKVHDRRAWHMFSKTLTKFEDDFNAGTRKMAPLAKSREAYTALISLATSFLGTMAAVSFQAFVESDYESLDANTILNKFSDDVEKRLIEISKRDNNVPEYAAYNRALIDFMKKHVKTKLSVVQGKNLSRYIMTLPNEPIANFWTSFNKELPAISEDWYNTEEKTGDYIMSKLVNPNALPKTAKK